ncbi:MAG TPA: hypothetical protein VGL72_02000 [Bryobacteraceae bacterium]
MAAPSGCIRTAAGGPASTPAIPALNLPDVTISGGQVLSFANAFQTSNNVYYTFNGCVGTSPSITLTFQGPVSNVNIGAVGQVWSSSTESLLVQDDHGNTQTVLLFPGNGGPSGAGTSITVLGANIHRITLSLPSSAWAQPNSAGFYIDNLNFYSDNKLQFVDPVPDLMSGTGLVSDPETLATEGTLVRAVAADGVARVLLAAQASYVGEMITMAVINDRGNPSNSTQDDGGIAPVNGSSSSKQQSIRVAAQDSFDGPMAFAVYYPPSDFSRGSQDDSAASRTIQIQVNEAGSAYQEPLTILRPPVVLVHDLWESPADWDTFTPFINDPRFFIRRASYDAVLGNRISASIPVYPVRDLAMARENSLGVGYNAPLVLSQIAAYVNEFRTVQNAAAAQADVVVHGMGGAIVRALVQLPNYGTPETYGQGSVDKLITIGTPHFGTPLAEALLRNDNSCFAGVLASGGGFSLSSATVDGNTVTGAIGDLQGNGFGGNLSTALARIQTGSETVPTAMLAGSINLQNTLTLGGGVGNFIHSSCTGSLASSLTPLGWFLVFVDANDAFAGVTSQLAGTFGFGAQGLVHSDGMEAVGLNPPGELDAQSGFSTSVVNLLNTSVRSNSFHPLP